MGRLRQTKNPDLVQAKKAILRKVTFMKCLELIKVLAIVAIALKYLGLFPL